MVIECPVCSNKYDMPRIYALHLSIAHDGWDDNRALERAIKDFNLSADAKLFRWQFGEA